MSLMKRYAEDFGILQDRAMNVAWISDQDERVRALTGLLGECDSAAEKYADPEIVAGMLKSAVVTAYQSESNHTRKGEAA